MHSALPPEMSDILDETFKRVVSHSRRLLHARHFDIARWYKSE